MTPDARTLVSPWLVVPPVGVALACEALAWLALSREGVLGPAFWYGRPDLLVAVHFVTVGVLAALVFGLGW